MHRHSSGLVESVMNLAATLVAMVRTRLDLLSADVEVQREHLTLLLAMGVAALFCLGIGIVLATLLVAAAFWDTHGLLVLGIMAGLFLAAGGAVMATAVYKSRARPRLFEATLSELLKDHQHLVSGS